MSDIVAIVEGPTEQTFVRDHLAAHLGGRGIYMTARLPGRVVRRGGGGEWESVRGDILRTLRERRGRICTTMFDFYGMPHDWPGRAEAINKPLDEKGPHVEQALLDDLAAYAGDDFRRELFIPYVQVHEFEALLFADVAKMAEVLTPVSHKNPVPLDMRFKKILEQAGQPEAIDDSYENCPSRQIAKIVPAYRKRLYGPIVAGKIGLDVLKTACPHFGQWLARLESLPAGEIHG